MKEKCTIEPTFLNRLPEMVAHPHIEVIPFKSVWEKIGVLSPGSIVTITASPSKGIERTLSFIPELVKRGFKVVPHIAARSVRDHEHLRQISAALTESSIEEIFVIGGDNKDPIGEYSYSSKLLGDLLALNPEIKSVGVAGYPEGHRVIKDSEILRHLKDKITIAKSFGVRLHIKSQACYDPEKIANWIEMLHSEGVNAPLYLGIPTPTDAIKLAQISKEIGVKDSIAYLQMTGFGSAIKSIIYNPNRLLEALGNRIESNAITQLHVFTFNDLTSTVDWQRNFKPASQ